MPDILLSVGYQFQSLNQGIASIVSQAQRGFQPLGKITGAANEFKKSLEASNARVIAFGASAGALYALRAAFTKLVGSAVEVESALTEINTLLQVSTKDLGRFSTELFRVASATGTSFTDAAKAAQEFARQGLSLEQTLQRTKSALTLTRLSGLALEDSVSSLTAALNSFGKEALTDIEIVNRLANVDAKFAVSAADLAEALKRVSGSAADAGIEFNKVIALVTAAQQATARGGSVIGNSFKTIFTRLQRPQVLDDLETAGVKVRDLNGEALDLISVLRNLSNGYDSLSSAQKSFVAESVGGVYQINILKSVLGDLGSGFSTFERAFRVAGDTSAIAERRLSELNNTISTRLVQTMNNLTKASAGAGEALFGQTIRNGLSSFDRILNAKEKLNSLFGGSEDSGVGSFVGASIGKGISNILSGPAIQFAVFGLIKLFQRLATFAIDSVKDLTSINQKEKEREALNKLVVDQLNKQKSTIHELGAGTKSVNDVITEIVNSLKASNRELALMATFVPALSKGLSNRGVTGYAVNKAAAGYVPSLDIISSEVAGARSAGYMPGNVIATTVRDGMRSIPIIANSAESKTSVEVGGKTYDFINPPKNSIAGRIHAMKSRQKTGVDPYASMGFVPNLALDDMSMGDIVRSMQQKANNMTLRKSVISQASRFVETTPEVKNKPGTSFDREFLISALTNSVLGSPIAPFDMKIVREQLQISDSLFEMLAEGLRRKVNTPELTKRIAKGEFARGFIPNLTTEYTREQAEKLGLKLNNPTKKVFVLGLDDNPADYEGKGVQAFYSTKDAIELGARSVDSLNRGDGSIMKRLWSDDGGYVSVSNAPAIFNNKIRSEEFGGRYVISKAGVQGARDTTDLGKLAIQQFRDVSGRTAQIAASSDDERNYKFDIDDVRSMLSLRGREFSGLFAFEDFNKKTPLTKSGETFGKTTVGGENVTVPFKFAGLKNPERVYAAFSKSYQQGLDEAEAAVFGELSGNKSVTNEGQSFGNFFDSVIKRKAKQLGLDIGENVNENLDIVGFNPKLASIFNSQAPFAAADVKGGFNQEAFDKIAEKIVRVLAFKKGGGSVTTPVFGDVAKFSGKNVGLFLSDKFVTADGKEDTEAFGVALYKALATGKPFRTNIGSSRSPDGITAAKIFQDSARMGKYITSAADVSKYDEYVLVSTSKMPERVSKDLLGLAIGSSSDVVGYRSGDPAKEEHEGVFKTLQQRLGNRFKFGSRGIIPNLSAIKDALSRENRATGGWAMLDSDPSLMTAENPLGFAAVDKRTQGNAKTAINQHKMLGQSMSYIKRAGASKGYVPNLAIDDGGNSFLLSAILASSQFSAQTVSDKQFDGVLGKVQKSLVKFTSNFEDFNKKAFREQKEWLESLEIAKKDLRLGSKNGGKDSVDLQITASGRTRNFKKADEIDNVLGKAAESIGNKVKAFDTTLQKEKEKIRGSGQFRAFTVGLGGGVASSAAGLISPDASKAVDQFVNQVQLGGQAMLAFPNKLGKTIGTLSIFTGAASAIDTLVKGFEGAKRQYEIQLSQSQKMTAQFDQLSQALANLDSMVLDSSVTLETLNKENRRFSEALAKLSSLGPEGQNYASEIQQEPDTKGKQRILQKSREFISKRDETLSSALQIKELGDERTSFGKFAGLSGGIFGFKNQTEKLKANQVVQNNAFSAISNLTDEEKGSLVNSVKNKKDFENTALKTDSISSLVKTIKESGGTSNDVSVIFTELRKILASEAVSSDENVKTSRGRALKANESAQSDVDNASRNELSLRRLFLNSGALRGQNFLDVRKADNRRAFGEFEVNDSRQKGESARLSQIFGEETVAAFEVQMASARIQAERAQKISNSGGQLSKGILDIFSQPLEGFVKAIDTGKGPESISETKQALIQAINTGLSTTIGNGDLSRFVGGDGQIDFDAFQKEIVNNSGAKDNTAQELSKFLSSNKSNLDVLRLVQQGNNELVEINQDALKELQMQTVKLENLRREIDVRRQSNFLGGSRALTDRNARRETNRQFIRGARLMETGQTAETRGRGAFMFLDAIKQFGLNPLAVAKQDAKTGLYSGSGDGGMTDKVAAALNIAVEGLKDVQTKQEGRISGSIGRLGSGSLANQIIQNQFGSELKGAAAGIGIGSSLKPEGDTIIQQAMNSLKDSTLSVNSQLDISVEKLKGFSAALDNVRDELFGNKNKNIIGAIEKRELTQKTQKEVRDRKNNLVEEQINNATKKQNLPTEKEQKEMDDYRDSLNVGGSVAGGLGVLGGLGYLYARNRKRVNEVSKTFGKGTGSLISSGARRAGEAYRDFRYPPLDTSRPVFSDIRPSKPANEGLVMNPDSGKRKIDFFLARQEMEARETYKKRTQNAGLKASLARGLEDAMSFNPAKQPNPSAVNMNRYSVSGARINALNPEEAYARYDRLKAIQAQRAQRNLPTGMGLPKGMGLPRGMGIMPMGMPRFGGGGGMLGGMLLGNLAERATGDTSGLAYMAGSSATSALGGLPAAFSASSLGGAGGALAASPAGVGVAAGASAYGGWQAGKGIYRSFNSKTFKDLSEGTTDSTKRTFDYVDKSLSKGNSSAKEIKEVLDAQIRSTQGQVQGKFRSFISHSSKENEEIKKSIEAMQALRDSIDQMVAQKGQEKAQKDYQEKLLMALQNMGTGEGTGANTSISVEISLKDVDKLPNIFNEKVIRPLEQQLKGLQNRTYNIEQSVGINPQPAGL
jgi:TP901 family phage tail tape measure protein